MSTKVKKVKKKQRKAIEVETFLDQNTFKMLLDVEDALLIADAISTLGKAGENETADLLELSVKRTEAGRGKLYLRLYNPFELFA